MIGFTYFINKTKMSYTNQTQVKGFSGKQFKWSCFSYPMIRIVGKHLGAHGCANYLVINVVFKRNLESESLWWWMRQVEFKHSQAIFIVYINVKETILILGCNEHVNFQGPKFLGTEQNCTSCNPCQISILR